MILYQFLLFIATAVNDTGSYVHQKNMPFKVCSIRVFHIHLSDQYFVTALLEYINLLCMLFKSISWAVPTACLCLLSILFKAFCKNYNKH